MGSSEVKAILYMPSLDLEEMRLVFPEFTPDVLQFKFDVVGGNPRKISVIPPAVARSELFDVVQSSVQWMFGAEYIPSRDAHHESEKQRLGKWAINIVVTALEQALRKGNTNTPKTDCSLFKEFLISGIRTVTNIRSASSTLLDSSPSLLRSWKIIR